MENVKSAATIILIRDRADHSGIEVYMTKRPDSMLFLPAYYVFPGGGMHQEDRDPQLAALCCTQFSEVETAYAITAIRECFEEVGYLLAGSDGIRQSSELLQSIRDRINDKTLSFRDWILKNNMPLRTDRMRYYGHRITPPNRLPRRFDTRYFLTVVSENEQLQPCEREVDSAAWIDPGFALEQALAGNYQMVLPTRDVLADLANFRTTEEAFRLAAGVGTPRPHELA